MKLDLLDLITFPFDDETKRHLLNYYQAKGTLLDSDLIEEHLINQPALGCLVLFLAFLTLVSLLFAIIFVSCRALGNCGAKRYQPHPTSGRRYSFHLVIFLLSWVFLCSSSVYFIYSGVTFWSIRIPPAFDSSDLKLHELSRRSVDYPDYSNHDEHKMVKREKPTQSVFDLFSNPDYEGDFEKLDPSTTSSPVAAFVTAARPQEEPIPIGIVRNDEKKFFAPLDYSPIPPRPTLPVIEVETTPAPALQKLAIRKIQREQVRSEVVTESPKSSTLPILPVKHYEIPARPAAEIEYIKKMKNDKRVLSAPFIADVPSNQAFQSRRSGTGSVQSTVSQTLPAVNQVDADLSPLQTNERSSEEPPEITEEQLMEFARRNKGADLPSDVKFVPAEAMTTTTEETTTVTQPTTTQQIAKVISEASGELSPPTVENHHEIIENSVKTMDNQSFEVVTFEPATGSANNDEKAPLKIVQTNDEPIQARAQASNEVEATQEVSTKEPTTTTTEPLVNIVQTLEHNDSPSENSILDEHVPEKPRVESEEDSFDPFVVETTSTEPASTTRATTTRLAPLTVQGIRIADRSQVEETMRSTVTHAAPEVTPVVPESEEYEDSAETSPVIIEPTTTIRTTEVPTTRITTIEATSTSTTTEPVVSEEVASETEEVETHTTEKPTTTSPPMFWPEQFPVKPEVFSPAWNRRKWTTERITQEAVTVTQPTTTESPRDPDEHLQANVHPDPKSQEEENDYGDDALELSREKLQVITAKPPTAPPTTEIPTTRRSTTLQSTTTTTESPSTTISVNSQEDESTEFVVIQKKPNDMWERQSTKPPTMPRNFSVIPTVSLAGDGLGVAHEMLWSRLYAYRLLHTSSVFWMSRLALILVGSLMVVTVLPTVALVGFGSVCYMKSYHPMDRTKTSDKVGQVVVLLSTILLFCLPLILLFVIGAVIYTHLHNAVCPLLQLQYQQSLGLIGNISSFSETTGEIIQRLEVNSHNCINSQVPLEGMWIASLLFLVSAVPVLVSLFKLSKYYLRMKTEYYWTMDDHYGTIYAKRALHTDGIYGNIYGTLRAPVRPNVRPPPIPTVQPPPNLVYASEPIYAEGPGPLYQDGPIYGAYAAYGAHF